MVCFSMSRLAFFVFSKRQAPVSPDWMSMRTVVSPSSKAALPPSFQTPAT